MIANILTIAGTDCTGGAGIQADIKAMSANGGYAMSVITTVVAQNTQGVQRVEMLSTDMVKAQIDAVFSDVRVDAVKIGMLGTSEMIDCVAQALKQYKPSNIVLDPVMVAKSGDRLLSAEAVHVLREVLLPMVDLITPNLPEAADLLKTREATSKEEMLAQAAALQVPVYLKGGHLQDSHRSPDLLYFPDLLNNTNHIEWLDAERVQTNNSHGTGCTLSAAIATFLGQGDDMMTACTKAKNYLTAALKHADELDVGQGHGPVHHFYKKY